MNDYRLEQEVVALIKLEMKWRLELFEERTVSARLLMLKDK